MTSAKRTSPCRLSEPQPSTVMVPPVIVAPARGNTFEPQILINEARISRFHLPTQAHDLLFFD
jgi:hypothetical protein